MIIEPGESGESDPMSQAPDSAANAAEPTEQNIEIKNAAEAGSSTDTEVTPTAEVTPAGAAPPPQPKLDLTAEPVRPWHANVSSLHETRDSHEFWLGPLRVIVHSAERADDDSVQAAATSMLRFTYGGVATAVVTATVSEFLADPTGIDLLLIGGGSGAGVIVLGVALNAYRLLRPKR